MDVKLRKGTRVKIVKDVREREPATGKTAKFVGYKEREMWILFGADGTPETESYYLPDGYAEWKSEKEDFPKVKCGIRLQNPIFHLDDGSEIHGGQCYWEPINPKVKKKLESAHKELLRKLGDKDSEKTLKDFQKLWR